MRSICLTYFHTGCVQLANKGRQLTILLLWKKNRTRRCVHVSYECMARRSSGTPPHKIPPFLLCLLSKGLSNNVTPGPVESFEVPLFTMLQHCPNTLKNMGLVVNCKKKQ